MKVFPQKYEVANLKEGYNNAMGRELTTRGFYRELVSLEHMVRLGHPSHFKRDAESLQDGLEINAHFLSDYDGDIVREQAWSQYAFFPWKLGRIDEALDALEQAIAATENVAESNGLQYIWGRRYRLEDHRILVLLEARPDELRYP